MILVHLLNCANLPEASLRALALTLFLDIVDQALTRQLDVRVGPLQLLGRFLVNVADLVQLALLLVLAATNQLFQTTVGVCDCLLLRRMKV